MTDLWNNLQWNVLPKAIVILTDIYNAPVHFSVTRFSNIDHVHSELQNVLLLQWFRWPAPALRDTHTQRWHTHCYTHRFRHRFQRDRWTGPTCPPHITVTALSHSFSFCLFLCHLTQVMEWNWLNWPLWDLCCVLLRALHCYYCFKCFITCC